MSEKKTVVVASNNAHKIEEIRAILGAVLPDAEFKAMGEIGGLPEPEETGAKKAPSSAKKSVCCAGVRRAGFCSISVTSTPRSAS